MRNLSRLALPACLLAVLAACGGGGSTPPPPSDRLTLSLSSNAAQVFPGQSAATVNANLSRTGSTGSVTLTVQGLPTGAASQIQSPGGGNSGSVTLGAGTAATGTYALTVRASDGTLNSTSNLTLTVGVSVQVENTVAGRLDLAMSTSFQPAEWDYQFFQNFPGATVPLDNLLSQKIRLQAVSQGIPQTGATTWDFTKLDAITQPVLTVTDHSPEFQVAFAPSFMYGANQAFLDPSYQQFAGYAQDLVRYYNTGGFAAADGTHVSPSSGTYSITWWGIYNEPNINHVTPAQYVQMYNTVVPAMQTVDPSLKFVAVELADFGNEPQTFVPTFVNGVTAQVDAVATHFYSSCNQRDSDTQIFATVPGFASDVQFFYDQMATNPLLASLPVWVTENNVNADFDRGGGISACNGTTFVADRRGSSAFFAAWRPYVFSQLGRVGTRALYHWDFDADVEFGEVDYSTANLQLSYWVDYWLTRMFPSPPGADILGFTDSANQTGLEILPVKNPDGSAVVMVANRAVNAAADNNGPGAPRSVLLDVSSLGTFTTASTLTIDANTSTANGPGTVSVTPAAQITVSLNGYGVVFLTLQ